MYCNECGAQVNDDALFCPKCGHQMPVGDRPTGEALSTPTENPAPVGESASVEPPPPTNAHKGGCSWALTAGMLAGCAILLIVGLALLGVYQGMQERTQLNRAAAVEHYQNGLEQISAEKYELAQAEFELAVQLDPKNKEALAKLQEVNALLSSKATPTSAFSYQTAELLFNEARDLSNQGDWEGVISRLEKVVALEPEYERALVTELLVEAYSKGGLKLVDENRMAEAIRYFDRALELSPASQEIRDQRRLALLYVAGLDYWGANWQGVIDNFSALYQLKPDYKDTRQRLYDAYVAYGDVLAAKGDWCGARDRYSGALAMTPGDALQARRDQAAQNCAIAPQPTGTPPAKGTFVGKLLKTEDVGRQEAMMIRGYVRDAQGKPLVGIKVGLSAFDWSAPPATTNEEGIFAFDGLGNPVTYTVKLVDLPCAPMPVKTDWSKLVWVEFRPQP